jgi:hypothetical protein
VAKGRGQVRWIKRGMQAMSSISSRPFVTLEFHNFQYTPLSRHEPCHCETIPRQPLSSARSTRDNPAITSKFPASPRTEVHPCYSQICKRAPPT